MTDAASPGESLTDRAAAVISAMKSTGHPMRASELATYIGLSRALVARVLHEHPRLFRRDLENRWLLRSGAGGSLEAFDDASPLISQAHTVETSDADQSRSSTLPAVLRRPGPFGPAASLLPPGQLVRYIEHEEPVAIAIETMLDGDFSQLPVRRDGRVIGIISWRDLPKQLIPLQTAKATIARVLADPVSNFMEPAAPKHFVKPTQFIDTTVDWAAEQFVLVGDELHVLGILTIADVWSALNRFAEAFVILNELETALRELIRRVAGNDLAEWLSAVSSPDGRRTVTRLDQLHFADYSQIILNRVRWPRFEPYLPGARDLLTHQLDRANTIRNDALHFRGEVSPSRCEHLRRVLYRVRLAIDSRP